MNFLIYGLLLIIKVRHYLENKMSFLNGNRKKGEQSQVGSSIVQVGLAATMASMLSACGGGGGGGSTTSGTTTTDKQTNDVTLNSLDVSSLDSGTVGELENDLKTLLKKDGDTDAEVEQAVSNFKSTFFRSDDQSDSDVVKVQTSGDISFFASTTSSGISRMTSLEQKKDADGNVKELVFTIYDESAEDYTKTDLSVTGAATTKQYSLSFTENDDGTISVNIPDNVTNKSHEQIGTVKNHVNNHTSKGEAEKMFLSSEELIKKLVGHAEGYKNKLDVSYKKMKDDFIKEASNLKVKIDHLVEAHDIDESKPFLKLYFNSTNDNVINDIIKLLKKYKDSGKSYESFTDTILFPTNTIVKEKFAEEIGISHDLYEGVGKYLSGKKYNEFDFIDFIKNTDEKVAKDYIKFMLKDKSDGYSSTVNNLYDTIKKLDVSVSNPDVALEGATADIEGMLGDISDTYLFKVRDEDLPDGEDPFLLVLNFEIDNAKGFEEFEELTGFKTFSIKLDYRKITDMPGKLRDLDYSKVAKLLEVDGTLKYTPSWDSVANEVKYTFSHEKNNESDTIFFDGTTLNSMLNKLYSLLKSDSSIDTSRIESLIKLSDNDINFIDIPPLIAQFGEGADAEYLRFDMGTEGESYNGVDKLSLPEGFAGKEDAEFTYQRLIPENSNNSLEGAIAPIDLAATEGPLVDGATVVAPDVVEFQEVDAKLQYYYSESSKVGSVVVKNYGPVSVTSMTSKGEDNKMKIDLTGITDNNGLNLHQASLLVKSPSLPWGLKAFEQLDLHKTHEVEMTADFWSENYSVDVFIIDDDGFMAKIEESYNAPKVYLFENTLTNSSWGSQSLINGNDIEVGSNHVYVNFNDNGTLAPFPYTDTNSNSISVFKKDANGNFSSTDGVYYDQSENFTFEWNAIDESIGGDGEVNYYTGKQLSDKYYLNLDEVYGAGKLQLTVTYDSDLAKKDDSDLEVYKSDIINFRIDLNSAKINGNVVVSTNGYYRKVDNKSVNTLEDNILFVDFSIQNFTMPLFDYAEVKPFSFSDINSNQFIGYDDLASIKLADISDRYKFQWSEVNSDGSMSLLSQHKPYLELDSLTANTVLLEVTYDDEGDGFNDDVTYQSDKIEIYDGSVRLKYDASPVEESADVSSGANLNYATKFLYVSFDDKGTINGILDEAQAVATNNQGDLITNDNGAPPVYYDVNDNFDYQWYKDTNADGKVGNDTAFSGETNYYIDTQVLTMGDSVYIKVTSDDKDDYYSDIFTFS